jgi:hypothetical protein
MATLRQASAVLAGSALLMVAAGCRIQTEMTAPCVSYPGGLSSSGTIVIDIDVPLEVAPGETFTITARDVTVVGVSSDVGPQFPNGILSVTGPVSPAGDVVVGEDVLTGGMPLPTTLTYTATGDPGDTIGINIQRAQAFYGNYLHGQRYTCEGQGRQVAAIAVVSETA